MASSIDLMWYRVQALSYVAWGAPAEQVDAILDRCVREADEEADRYRGVAVLAWVIDAARERGRRRQASQILAQAMGRMKDVEPAHSRGAALELLAGAASRLSLDEHVDVCRRLLDLAYELQRSPYKRLKK
jgi:hypothetical protein